MDINETDNLYSQKVSMTGSSHAIASTKDIRLSEFDIRNK
jgi:hypothetical protein